MGFRFQKRIKILPGLRINLSKTGISTSLGGKGLTVNFRGNNVKTTVGLPGSGLSYSKTLKDTDQSMAGSVWILIVIGVVMLIWFTF